MAKKKQEIRLEGLADIDFSSKEPDIESAQSIIEPVKKEKKEKPASTIATRSVSAKSNLSPQEEKLQEPVVRQARSTFPPERKKRATFNIDEDLHKALKDYSFFEEVDMVEYVFEHLVKRDLEEKGYYPPKKRKR